MPESDETQQDIKEMKWHVEKVDKKLNFILRGNGDALERIAEVFRGDEKVAQVYLLIDGRRTQSEIVDEVDFSAPTVSRRIQDLSNNGLIQKKGYDDGIIWERDEVDSIFNLEDKVDPETGWNDD